MGKWELARRRAEPFPRIAASEAHQRVFDAPASTSFFVSGAAGSGKTTLLIHRALHLIESGMDPSRILVLTFSRDHADYLRDAIAINARSVAREPLARTFSSLAFSIVRLALEEDVREPILISGAEQDQFIRSLLTAEDEAGNWPTDLAQALPTRGFAKELRDLLSRAKEWGLGWKDLEALGVEASDENWISASRFWRRMEEVSILRESNVGDPKERIDPSELINRASMMLERSPELTSRVTANFDLILIDHFEESDPSHRRLLRALQPKALTIFHCIASTVSRFRGADPEGLERFLDSFESDFKESHFSSPERIELGSSLVSEPSLKVFEADSVAEEARVIADYVRARHLRDGIAYGEIAVLVRSPGEHLSTIRRTLTLAGVPVAQERGTQSLAESSAIKPIITIAQLALGTLSLSKENFDSIAELLLSEFGGLDPLRLRRLRERINRDRDEGDLRPTDEVILSALSDQEVDLPFDPNQDLRPLAQLLRRARKVARKKGSTVTDLLWEIWSSARRHDGELLSETWRMRALESHSLYDVAAADRDLDLVTELFEVARRYVERFPYASPGLFIEELKGTKIFGDVIAPEVGERDRVSLSTIHSAKGQSWRVVIVAGVQEGIWPNLKSRGSLLGSERLVEIQRYGLLPRAELSALSATALLEDETRLFDFALKRASEHLFVTAVAREDDLPSSLFYRCAERIEMDQVIEEDSPLSPLPLIAQLRRQVISGPEETRKRAATLLKTLAREGFHWAHPSNWLGFHQLSTEAPLVDPDEEIRVSPSELDRFIECQLRWFLEKSGARDGDSQAALLGSAIHAYAKLIADDEVSIDEAKSRLEKTWHLIDSATGWVHRHELRRALRMLDRFFQWHSSNDRRLIAAEAELDLTLGRVHVRGSADRIEINDEGRLFIVDLKTSTTALSAKDAEANLQLATYQSALAQGGFESIADRLPSEVELGGALLVYPATDAQSITTREQRPVDPTRILGQVEQEAIAMAGREFIATINTNCTHCSVRTLCPMQSSGKSVIEG